MRVANKNADEVYEKPPCKSAKAHAELRVIDKCKCICILGKRSWK